MSDQRRWERFARRIEDAGTYYVTTVGELLFVADKLRAGVQIVVDIERDLAANKIGHLPARIPRDQHAKVFLYNQDVEGYGFALHLFREILEDPDPTGEDAAVLAGALAMFLDSYRPGHVEGARRT